MNTQTKKILLIEDEPDLVRGLTDALEFEGFQVMGAHTGKEGLELATREHPDAVILDLMLPDMNGYRICEELREKNPILPIIMLTARSQEADKIRGLDVGADDYVTKPFSVGELIARINAIFRRLGRLSTADETIAVGDAEINLTKHTLTRGRKTEHLTFYEVELLKLLHERSNQPVSRDEILERVWGIKSNPQNRTVDNFIVKLRRKLEDDHKHPQHIVTVYGFGYKLVP